MGTNAEGWVESISLESNHLSGSFAASDWLNLSELTWLNIANNNLTGCFDSLSLSLCEQLNSSYFDGLRNIDEGNNFVTIWQVFCETGICESKLVYNCYQPVAILFVLMMDRKSFNRAL